MLLLFFTSAAGRYSFSSFEDDKTDHESTLNKTTPLNVLHYAAFFGDCEHEVEPVTYGNRLTLAYTLRRVDVKDDVEAAQGVGGPVDKGEVAVCEGAVLSPSPSLSLLTSDEQAMLSRARNFQHSLTAALDQGLEGPLGFACVHLYEDRQLPPVEEPLPPDTTAGSLHLKGADALVCVTAAHLNLEVTVVRLVTETCAGTRWSVKKIPDLPLIKRFGSTGVLERGGVSSTVD